MGKAELHIMADYQTGLLSESMDHSGFYLCQIRSELTGLRKEVTCCPISTSRSKTESW